MQPYKKFVFVALMFASLSVILQFYYAIRYWTAYGLAISSAITQFFSYYTILANILVVFTFLAYVWRNSPFSRLLKKPYLLFTGVNIIFVGAAYSLLLRRVWKPVGLQFFINESLHTILPLAFVLFYVLCHPKGKISMKQLFGWQLFPLTYALFIFSRGYITGLYPYPFFDLHATGSVTVMKYVLSLQMGFFILSFLLRFLDEQIQRKYSGKYHNIL